MHSLLLHIRRLKQRHWIAIGLILGLAVACIEVLLTGFGAARLTPGEFESALTSVLIDGHPVSRDATVHLRGSSAFVTMDRLQPITGAFQTSGPVAYEYVPVRLDPEKPFIPMSAPSQMVEVRINPAAAMDAMDAGKDADPRFVPLCINNSVIGRWSSRLALTGWSTSSDGSSADPGDGAEAAIGLRLSDYRLLVLLDPSEGELSLADHLAISLNGKPLEPLIRTDERTVWQTHVSQGSFVLNERQLLRFVSKDAHLKIRQIELVDPDYGILDYLAYVKGTYPYFDYGVGWWDDPKVAFPLFGGLGAFLLGIFLPLVIRVFLRTRELMLLAKSKRRSAMSSLLPGSPKLTLEDWMQIIDLIGALETSLREVLAEQARASVGGFFRVRAEPHPADTFVQRDRVEPTAVVEEEHGKDFGCKKDDVYPTELGAAAGQVLYTAQDVEERNEFYRLRSRKSAKPKFSPPAPANHSPDGHSA